ASPYRVTLNYAFDRVIDGCANHRDEGTWITRGIEEAYRRLHEHTAITLFIFFFPSFINTCYCINIQYTLWEGFHGWRTFQPN
ncbi:hypothetical protein ONK20_25955, partial [Salmonella enterica subsp. enterica serovar Montevideo]|nr:hypothetical protein [Salmonella enterica subsp. enterica serovar Montevideo]